MSEACDCDKCKERHLKHKLKEFGFKYNQAEEGLYINNGVDWKFFPLMQIKIISICEKMIKAMFWYDSRTMSDEASDKSKEIKSWPVSEVDDFLTYCKEYLES